MNQSAEDDKRMNHPDAEDDKRMNHPDAEDESRMNRSAELWTLRVDRALTPVEQTRLWAKLPAARAGRLARMDRRAGLSHIDGILCAYGLLHRALRETFDWRTIPEIRISHGGKPYFGDCPGIRFNISHTAGAVLVGLSGGPVGVDIELRRPVSEHLRRRIPCHTVPYMPRGDGMEEFSVPYAPRGDGMEEFFREWVFMEAVGKWNGGGILPVLNGRISGGFRYETVETFPGYTAGIAVNRGVGVGRVHIRTLDDILS